MPQWCVLEDRGVLRLSGETAVSFLNGLVTNDISKIAGAGDGTAAHAGLLSPQGKILFEFIIIGAEGRLFIDVARVQVADLLKRLTFYRLRAAVDIADVSEDWRVVAVWDGTATPGVGDSVDVHLNYVDPRHATLGTRLLVPADQINRIADDANRPICPIKAYDAHRIHLGVAEIGKDYPAANTYPHEANFDLFNGVSFSKGCYVGQEVVSRMQHKAVVRNRIVRIEGQRQLTTDTDITFNGIKIGRVGSVAGKHALALIRLDRATEAIDAMIPIKAGDVDIAIEPQALARYRTAVADKAAASPS